MSLLAPQFDLTHKRFFSLRIYRLALFCIFLSPFTAYAAAPATAHTDRLNSTPAPITYPQKGPSTNTLKQLQHQPSPIIRVTIYSTENPEKILGHITAKDTPAGLKLTPDLYAFPETEHHTEHGFHIHKFANCGDHGKDAGGHWDPEKTGHHRGPYKKGGHKGDLPVLIINKDGRADKPVIAPRLKLKDLLGHSLVIHQRGDNYTDQPENGGGGARIACGAVSKEALF